MRIIVFGGLYSGALIFRNYHIKASWQGWASSQGSLLLSDPPLGRAGLFCARSYDKLLFEYNRHGPKQGLRRSLLFKRVPVSGKEVDTEPMHTRMGLGVCMVPSRGIRRTTYKYC